MKLAQFIMLPFMFLINGCNSTSFDYTRLIHLDAEDLCESGMLEGYASVIPAMKKITAPQPMKEIERKDSDDYSISIGGIHYPVYIYGEHDVGDCWESATNVFFHVINKQILDTDYKFYAFYHGNDLQGGFLNKHDVQGIIEQNPNEQNEWPYLPNKPTDFNVMENEQ